MTSDLRLLWVYPDLLSKADLGTHTCRQVERMRTALTVIHSGSPGPTPMP